MIFGESETSKIYALSLIPFQSSVPFLHFWFAAFLGGAELEQSPQMSKAFLVIASLVTY